MATASRLSDRERVTRLRREALRSRREQLLIETSRGWVTNWEGRRHYLTDDQIRGHESLERDFASQLEFDSDGHDKFENLDRIFVNGIRRRYDDDAQVLEARLDLDRLVSAIRVMLLHEIAPEVFGSRFQIPPKEVNDKIETAYLAAKNLLAALTDAYDAFSQFHGIEPGKVFDGQGPGALAVDQYRGTEKHVIAVIELLDVEPLPEPGQKGGRPRVVPRENAVMLIRDYFDKWNIRKASRRSETFENFAVALFGYVGVDANNLRSQIGKIIPARTGR